MSDDDGTPTPPAPDAPVPAELARAALNRAKDAAQRRGAVPGSSSRGRRRDAPAPRTRPGDPELVGRTIDDLLTERGWDQRATVAALFGRWPDLVGEQLAEHCAPRSYEDGRLHVTADSTAWATHLRALAPELVRRLTEELGAGVVRDVHITGPTAPSWRRGPRHVRGRGPRDTYG